MLAPALALCVSLAAAATPYAPDEAMEFTVEFHGIRTGKARIAVGRLEGTILPVFLQARTGGLLAVVDLKQQLASYLDAGTGLPRSASMDSVEPGYRLLTTTRFERANQKATVRQQGKFDNTYELDVPPDTLDFVALVFRLRTLPLEPGTAHEFQVLSARKVQKVTVQAESRERIKTKAGPFDTVKVRVPTQFSGKFSEKSPTYVWFTDDARRIVVRISTDFSIGRVVADLTAYRPGKLAEDAPAAQQTTDGPQAQQATAGPQAQQAGGGRQAEAAVEGPGALQKPAVK
ncbi:MAG TPA: DUF3108 domain-containing protein [Anaeromyxobacter sp.]|nr:DUF3108 domain-containing protein [Anaeromyxobacter sp.]